jgi:hypothetical protein
MPDGRSALTGGEAHRPALWRGGVNVTTFKPDDICFYCAHAFKVHTESGAQCATCTEARDGMPLEPGEDHPCFGFRKTGFCGECGARIAWHAGLNEYEHADPQFDEDHQPYWKRKSRVQQV